MTAIGMIGSRRLGWHLAWMSDAVQRLTGTLPTGFADIAQRTAAA
jgi:hypothetical protein